MKNPDKAAKVIAFFEGFLPVAKWDVNAYRLGYGSDTEGPDQARVKRGMTTTRERALENLKVRLSQFERLVVSSIDQESWDKLGENTQAALLSFAYNYGRLTTSLVAAAHASSPAISWQLQQREGDNNGVNAKRRFAEAALAASEEE